MTDNSGRKGGFSNKELQNLRGELWIIIPFFIFSLYIFLGSFRYKIQASTVPMLIGACTALLTAMRLIYIMFPGSRIGQFKESGLAGEFDHIKHEIEEEKLKGKYTDAPGKEITFKDEKKAIIALLGSFVAFLLFGYLVALFFVIVGTSLYYGYRDKKNIIISLVSMYVLCYVVLYKLLGAPADFGLLLGPILKSFRLI